MWSPLGSKGSNKGSVHTATALRQPDDSLLCLFNLAVTVVSLGSSIIIGVSTNTFTKKSNTNPRKSTGIPRYSAVEQSFPSFFTRSRFMTAKNSIHNKYSPRRLTEMYFIMSIITVYLQQTHLEKQFRPLKPQSHATR